ncbi:hypothetical protein FSB78_17220 [Sphingomonas ginsenosidivorax]|uniref:Uncharacterized protein n=1 Tax=Sphingomonas ginsenosidivorax TaxID=862135 RepID=A0A5C6UJU7_9SPHN|nr:hypothetical protein [Sphingomonas ginsenosidivorax]TXC72496.1 hypothetical protein FSB78_17220 [Sphingomonas ginsenosidivorax]
MTKTPPRHDAPRHEGHPVRHPPLTPLKPPRPPKASRTFGRTMLATGAAAIGLGGALVAVFLRRRKANPSEHAAPDLALGKPHPGPADRAPPAFRPDPTAVPTKAERDALRPATGAASFPDRHDIASRNTPVG